MHADPSSTSPDHPESPTTPGTNLPAEQPEDLPVAPTSQGKRPASQGQPSDDHGPTPSPEPKSEAPTAKRSPHSEFDITAERVNERNQAFDAFLEKDGEPLKTSSGTPHESTSSAGGANAVMFSIGISFRCCTHGGPPFASKSVVEMVVWPDCTWKAPRPTVERIHRGWS